MHHSQTSSRINEHAENLVLNFHFYAFVHMYVHIYSTMFTLALTYLLNMATDISNNPPLIPATHYLLVPPPWAVASEAADREEERASLSRRILRLLYSSYKRFPSMFLVEVRGSSHHLHMADEATNRLAPLWRTPQLKRTLETNAEVEQYKEKLFKSLRTSQTEWINLLLRKQNHEKCNTQNVA